MAKQYFQAEVAAPQLKHYTHLHTCRQGYAQHLEIPVAGPCLEAELRQLLPQHRLSVLGLPHLDRTGHEFPHRPTPAQEVWHA